MPKREEKTKSSQPKKRQKKEKESFVYVKPEEGSTLSTNDLLALIEMPVKDMKPHLKEAGFKQSGPKGELILSLYYGRKIAKTELEQLERELFHKNDPLFEFIKEKASAEEGFKAIALNRAATTISLLPFPVTSSEQIAGIKGLGKGSLALVDDFLSAQDNGDKAGHSDENGGKDTREGGEEDASAKWANFLEKGFRNEENVSQQTLAARTGLSEEETATACQELEEAGLIYSTLSETTFSRA